MKRYMLQVLIDERPGRNIDDAATRLAKRLESIGLKGRVEGGWDETIDDDRIGCEVRFGKEDKPHE